MLNESAINFTPLLQAFDMMTLPRELNGLPATLRHTLDDGDKSPLTPEEMSKKDAQRERARKAALDTINRRYEKRYGQLLEWLKTPYRWVTINEAHTELGFSKQSVRKVLEKLALDGLVECNYIYGKDTTSLIRCEYRVIVSKE